MASFEGLDVNEDPIRIEPGQDLVFGTEGRNELFTTVTIFQGILEHSDYYYIITVFIIGDIP